MRRYIVIETEAGLMVADQSPGVPAEQVAARYGGLVVDPGPYTTYQDAYDALLAIQRETEDEETSP